MSAPLGHSLPFGGDGAADWIDSEKKVNSVLAIT